MRVRLLLFAQYRDAAGRSELELDLPAGARACDAVVRLRAAMAAPHLIPDRPAVAINQEFAALDRVLEHGDELALLPPVAGG